MGTRLEGNQSDLPEGRRTLEVLEGRWMGSDQDQTRLWTRLSTWTLDSSLDILTAVVDGSGVFEL